MNGFFWLAESLTGSSIATALAVNAMAGGLAYRFRAVGPGGLIGGLVIGLTIWWAMGWQGWLLFAAFVVLGSTLSRLGYQRKLALGAAQEKGGRRGAVEAFANLLVAVAAAVCAATTSWFWAPWAFAGAVATALADTSASEVGPLLAPRARHPWTLRSVPAGTDGAISSAGTLAGALGALLIAALAWLLRILPASALLILPAAAILASWFESLLGAQSALATLRRNAILNFLNTLFGAGLAAWMATFAT